METDQTVIEGEARAHGWERTLHRYQTFPVSFAKDDERIQLKFSQRGRLTGGCYAGPSRIGIYMDKPIRMNDNDGVAREFEMLHKNRFARVLELMRA